MKKWTQGPIFVLGPPRSGTSLVCQILNAWGAYAGEPENLGQGDDANPEGYWEYRPLAEFQARLWESIGVSAWHPSFEELLDAHVESSEWTEAARALVDRMRASGRVWYWKYPELALLLPLWKRVLPEFITVVTVRHPVDSARSFLKEIEARIGMRCTDLTASLLMWQDYMVRIATHTITAPDSLYVAYESLVQDPVAQCRRVAGFLDACFETHGMPADRLTPMTAVAKSSLWHNQHVQPEVRLTEEQHELHALLTGLASSDASIATVGKLAIPIQECRLTPLGRDHLDTFAAMIKYYNKNEQARRTLDTRGVRATLFVTRSLKRLIGR